MSSPPDFESLPDSQKIALLLKDPLLINNLFNNLLININRPKGQGCTRQVSSISFDPLLLKLFDRVSMLNGIRDRSKAINKLLIEECTRFAESHKDIKLEVFMQSGSQLNVAPKIVIQEVKVDLTTTAQGAKERDIKKCASHLVRLVKERGKLETPEARKSKDDAIDYARSQLIKLTEKNPVVSKKTAEEVKAALTLAENVEETP